MSELPDLSSLSPEAKDALIETLWEEIQSLRKRLDKLENCTRHEAFFLKGLSDSQPS